MLTPHCGCTSMLPQVYLVYCSFRNTNAFGNFTKGLSLNSYKNAWKYVGQHCPIH